mgnify:FL=1
MGRLQVGRLLRRIHGRSGTSRHPRRVSPFSGETPEALVLSHFLRGQQGGAGILGWAGMGKRRTRVRSSCWTSATHSTEPMVATDSTRFAGPVPRSWVPIDGSSGHHPFQRRPLRVLPTPASPFFPPDCGSSSTVARSESPPPTAPFCGLRFPGASQSRSPPWHRSATRLRVGTNPAGTLRARKNKRQERRDSLGGCRENDGKIFNRSTESNPSLARCLGVHGGNSALSPAEAPGGPIGIPSGLRTRISSCRSTPSRDQRTAARGPSLSSRTVSGSAAQRQTAGGSES